MHMAKDNGQFNEYITKRELKRRFHIIDKHIARYFPEPVRINISKFGDTFRDAYPLSVVESVMQSNSFRNAYYSARGSTEPDAAERKTIRRRLDLCIKINNLLLGNKSLFIARCKKCGRRLPITHLYNTCDECRGKETEKATISATSNV